jgi:hypothetical protein
LVRQGLKPYLTQIQWKRLYFSTFDLIVPTLGQSGQLGLAQLSEMWILSAQQQPFPLPQLSQPFAHPLYHA